MPRRRNDCAALSPKQFKFRNKLPSFSKHSGFASHVIYQRHVTKLRNNGLSRYYCPMIIFLLFNVLILIATMPTLADSGAYRLRAGDTIEISISGTSEMRQTFVLDLDGQISVPLVGVIKAEGSTIGEFRDKLQQILPRDIAVNMVDYSPVYINGDVVKPGEQRFRPNMTVRQAVALAGGYEVMRYHLVDPIIQSADLGADYETLWTEQAREQARLARLKAELNNEDQLGAGPAESAPISNRLQNDIVNNESQQLALWHSNFDKEMASLTRAIKSATDQLAELVESRDKEIEGEAADAEELQRLSAFNKQGDVTSNRVVDARRAMLLSSTRVLQTEERIIQITREREGYIRQIEKFRDEGRSAILKEIEDSQLRLAATNARIAATADKMVYTSTMRSQLPLSKLGGPSVTIIRGDRGNRSKTEASEEFGFGTRRRHRDRGSTRGQADRHGGSRSGGRACASIARASGSGSPWTNVDRGGPSGPRGGRRASGSIACAGGSRRPWTDPRRGRSGSRGSGRANSSNACASGSGSPRIDARPSSRKARACRPDRSAGGGRTVGFPGTSGSDARPRTPGRSERRIQPESSEFAGSSTDDHRATETSCKGKESRKATQDDRGHILSITEFKNG